IIQLINPEQDLKRISRRTEPLTYTGIILHRETVSNVAAESQPLKDLKLRGNSRLIKQHKIFRIARVQMVPPLPLVPEQTRAKLQQHTELPAFGFVKNKIGVKTYIPKLQVIKIPDSRFTHKWLYPYRQT